MLALKTIIYDRGKVVMLLYFIFLILIFYRSFSMDDDGSWFCGQDFYSAPSFTDAGDDSNLSDWGHPAAGLGDEDSRVFSHDGGLEQGASVDHNQSHCEMFPHQNVSRQMSSEAAKKTDRQKTNVYYCPYGCDYHFTTLRGMRLHLKNSHSNEATIGWCFVCYLHFDSAESLRNHKKKAGHNPEQPRKLRCPHGCPKILSEPYMKEHVSAMHEGAMICSVCGLRGNSLHFLNKHFKTHNPEEDAHIEKYSSDASRHTKKCGRCGIVFWEHDGMLPEHENCSDNPGSKRRRLNGVDSVLTTTLESSL